MKRPLLAAAAALLLATTAHAGDDDYAKQQEALKKDGVQHFDYVRFVATAEKTTLGNLYALSVDCSPQEGSIRVRIVNAPEHGSVASEQGRGFTSFAQSNPRFKCNEKQVDMVLLNYRSEPNFTGTDKFDVLVLYPHGFAQTAHYTVNVK